MSTNVSKYDTLVRQETIFKSSVTYEHYDKATVKNTSGLLCLAALPRPVTPASVPPEDGPTVSCVARSP